MWDEPPSQRGGGHLTRSAYHEAGHALAAHALGFEVRWLRVVSPADSGHEPRSRIEYAHPGDPDDLPDPAPRPGADERAEMERRAVVSMAGLAAEDLITGASDPAGADEHADTELIGGFARDRVDVDDVVAFLGYGGAEGAEFRRRIRRHAEVLLARHRPALDALAAAAVAKRRLGRDEIARLLSGVRE